MKVFTTEIPADLETPVSAYLKLKPVGACFLLESAENSEKLGRYSFIGLNPIFSLSFSGKTDYLALLRGAVNQDPKIPALLGGLVGYIGYEVANYFEGLPLPKSNTPEGMPDIYMLRPETLVVFDHFQRRMTVLTLNSSALKQVTSALKSALPDSPDKKSSSLKPQSNISPSRCPAGIRGAPPAGRPSGPLVSIGATRYKQMTRQAQEYIRAGDIFQVVLARQLNGQTSAQPFQVYRALRMLNPSPYMFFFDTGEFCLVGSSPEMMVKLESGNVLLCPIAGTRPRGQTPESDAKLEKELLANPKENAEHAMLVDLGRNDLGRVCDFGSIALRENRKIERYSHVMHMASTIAGKLKQDKDMFDLFRAVFPAGTVTGAPKIRAMEIIAELEKTRRGPYAGAMGYFGSNGNMDMCITIRTIIFKGNRYSIQAGAGIVYDSTPALEYQETLNKMAVLRKAIEIAESGV